MQSKYDVHPTLVRYVLGEDAEEDYLALMVLFHTHFICFSQNVELCDVESDDSDSVIAIHPITRSHAGEILEQCTLPRKSAEYWHAKYNERTPYEVLEDVPEPLKSKISALRKRVLEYPTVVEVVED